MFYLAPDHNIKAARITSGGPSFHADAPVTLFSKRSATTSSASPQYTVTPDGERFLVLEPLEELANPMTLVINWLAGGR
jgi:hypothetical protein